MSHGTRIDGYPLGLRPRVVDDRAGFTVADAARLTNLSPTSVRGRVTDEANEAWVQVGEEPLLIAVESVMDARSELLERLGAIEGPAPSDSGADDVAALAAEVGRLRHQLRMLLSARDFARRRIRNELDEQAAMDDPLLVDLARTESMSGPAEA